MPRIPRAASAAVAVALAAGVAAAAVGVSVLRNDGTPTADRPPNIVVIMTDDQTLESLRVMPKVDELLAAKGVSFPDNVASYPLCCPSRATFLTGQYAHNHGVRGNAPPRGGFGAFEHQDTTFPVALQNAGYDTVHIGKYLNGYGSQAPAVVPPGWSEWHGSIDPTSYRYFGFALLENGQKKTYPDDEYQTDVYTDLAASAISSRAKSDAPFFLNVAYLAPHAEVLERSTEGGDDLIAAVPAPRHVGSFDGQPLPPSPSFDEADVKDKPLWVHFLPRISEEVKAKITSNYDRYLESLLAVDEGVDKIVAALQESGQLDNTVILFTSDNGYFFGEHRITAGKQRFYEPSIRVPLIIRGPGIPAGATRQSLVANIDLAPTILDLAGAKPLRTMDGQSLVPLLHDDQALADRSILLESGGENSARYQNYGVRTSRYAYFLLRSGERELYDLSSDPDQLVNRVRDPELAAVAEDMAAQLEVLKGCAGTTCHYP